MSAFQDPYPCPPFEVIYHDYTPLIHRMIRRLHIHSNHEDFLQVGYLGLWYAYRDYDEEKGPFSSYAFMRVRYEMLTMLRKDSKYQERHVYFSSDSPEIESLLDLTPEHLEPSDMDTLSPYFHHLSPREQLWMIEHAINDHAPRMIAAKHNVTTETVKGWRKNALRKLRKIMQ